MNTKKIEAIQISKSFKSNGKKKNILQNVSFSCDEHEIIALLGPSGVGKSTILNILAGITKQDEGEIRINGKIGYMFQKDLLFPWRTAYENIRLGQEINHEIDEDWIHSLLTMVGLSETKEKKPNELSGGMKERIALCRTLATKPDILLLDEPFASLDALTRTSIGKEVREIIKREGLCAVLVTHDIDEALRLADKIYILSKLTNSISKVYQKTNDESKNLKELIERDLNE